MMIKLRGHIMPKSRGPQKIPIYQYMGASELFAFFYQTRLLNQPQDGNKK